MSNKCLDILNLYQDILKIKKEFGNHFLSDKKSKKFQDSRALAKHLEEKIIEISERKFILDLSSKGLRLIRDNRISLQECETDNIEFCPLYEETFGVETRPTSVNVNSDRNLGQKHAEYFIKNQHLIPKELKDKLLVFFGTVWRQDLVESIYTNFVVYIKWDENRNKWIENYGNQDSYWGLRARLVRLKS